MEFEQLDVTTAFLHGDLEEKIYMQQPQMFEVKSETPLVCLLRKSLYGLKQAPRQWYKCFDDFMLSHGFTRNNYDWCVYHKLLESGKIVHLLLYVNDMLIACHDMDEILSLKAELSREFEMKDLGHAKGPGYGNFKEQT